MRKQEFIDSVSWDQLEHAYGPASDIAPLLKKIASSRGRAKSTKLHQLCVRVLHQNALYSASPPVVHAVIRMLDHAKNTSERVLLYGVLTKFAEAANKSGVGPEAAAIRREVLSAQDRFVGDLAHSDPTIRRQAAMLVVMLAEERSSRHYFASSDPAVRHILLSNLVRSRPGNEGWTRFLVAALEGETDPASRFLLRYAEVCEARSAVATGALEELISTFIRCCEDDPRTWERFAIAAHGLTEEEELQALAKALKSIRCLNACRFLSEQLLRLIFQDERTGWGQLSYSRASEDVSGRQGSIPKLILTMAAMRILPFLRERMLMPKRGPIGLPVANYWGLQGNAPVVPQKLTGRQKVALTALAEHPTLWQVRTNLWALFGLPDTAAELKTFVDERG